VWQNHSVNSAQRKLLGESVREIGVLVLVFVPLDMLLGSQGLVPIHYPSWMFWLRVLSPEHWTIIFFALAGIVLLYFGIKIESAAGAREKAEKGDN
jgi:hypothetical protein